MAFFCPVCGAPERSRERRPNGNSTCRDGHSYASKAALEEEQVFFTALNHVPDALRQYARVSGQQWVVGKEPSEDFNRIMTGLGQALEIAQNMVGPLVIAVPDHQLAEALASIFGSVRGPHDQGVRVIPFGASPLAYCGGGTLLFRALLVIPPRQGPIAHNVFISWVDQAFAPYLAPNAPKVVL